MKLTDFVAQYLVMCNIKHAFVLQGGAALHLIDSIEKNNNITTITMQHEQASAMAADGYARATQNMGCTISTSGPGATNLITGIASSFFDSVATIHITGNVASFRQSKNLKVRQYGFQETDIISIVKPICKYAVQIKKPEDILTELPKAIKIANSDRKGPVLIDIPDDFQRIHLDKGNANVALALINAVSEPSNTNAIPSNIKEMLLCLLQAKRPMLIFGAGMSTEHCIRQAKAFAKKYDLPYLTTWPQKGISDYSDPLNVGTFGTHSFRGNNIVLQNADFILSVGSRLDSRATAKLDGFAREAEIAMVDIDLFEMEKFIQLGLEVKYKVQFKTAQFFDVLLDLSKIDLSKKLSANRDISDWHQYIDITRNKFNYQPDYHLSGVNPYYAIKVISLLLKNDSNIVLDTGTCLPLTLVYAEEKEGQKYYSSFNNTPMGYSLPASIGIALATKSNSPIVVIVGDGGLQMNIQELATIAYLSLPIIIIVFNNNGHAMIKQTQDDWLDSNYFSASLGFGLPKINFTNIANGYGIASNKVSINQELEQVLSRAFETKKPYLIELDIHQDFRYEPIIKYGNPLENMSPLLENELIDNAMIVDKYT